MNMSDEELVSIAKDFRDGMLSNRSSDGCCFMVSAPLCSLLGVYGVDCDLAKSDVSNIEESNFIEHFWIKLADGRVLDPTFDQFCSEEKVKVYLGKPTEFHKEG